LFSLINLISNFKLIKLTETTLFKEIKKELLFALSMELLFSLEMKINLKFVRKMEPFLVLLKLLENGKDKVNGNGSDRMVLGSKINRFSLGIGNGMLLGVMAIELKLKEKNIAMDGLS
jgi:hypothetical protein